MSTNNGQDVNKKEDTAPPENVLQQSGCIFSREEIRTTVKNFALAWLNGAAKLRFRTASEIMGETKFTKEKKDWNQALREECLYKDNFLLLVRICTGTVQATPEQQEKALSDLFHSMLMLRAGERIEGSFTSTSDIEERIRRIEEDFEATKNFVFELSMAVKQWKPKE